MAGKGGTLSGATGAKVEDDETGYPRERVESEDDGEDGGERRVGER